MTNSAFASLIALASMCWTPAVASAGGLEGLQVMARPGAGTLAGTNATASTGGWTMTFYTSSCSSTLGNSLSGDWNVCYLVDKDANPELTCVGIGMVETADPGVVQLTCCKSYPCTGMCTTYSTVYVDNCVSMGSVASQSFRVMKTAPIPTSSCQSGSACNGVAMQSRCTGPGGSQVVYCLPDCPEGTNRAQIECLDGPDGGAECACGPGDLLCPEKSFCSTSSSFNSESCVPAAGQPEGCEYCCPAGDYPVTQYSCVAPFCACDGRTSNGNDANCNGNEGPLPNWAAASGTSGCVADDVFSVCREFVYLQYESDYTWRPVTKGGLPVTSCFDVCAGYCPEFFDLVDNLAGVCDFTYDCLDAGWKNLALNDKYLMCKGLPANRLAFIVANSEECWRADSIRPWPLPDLEYTSNVATCGTECNRFIVQYQAQNCSASSAAGKQVSAIRALLAEDRRSSNSDAPITTDDVIDALSQRRLKYGLDCSGSGFKTCPAKFNCGAK